MRSKSAITMIVGSIFLVVATAAATYGAVSQYQARPLNRQNLGVARVWPRP